MRIRLAALAALAAMLAAGCGSPSHAVKRNPIPAKPGAVEAPAHAAPSCSPKVEAEIRAGNGQAGNCSPSGPAKVIEGNTARRGIARSASLTVHVTGNTGPDLSNNDPVYDWRGIAAHNHPFGYVKLNQGAYFVDSTAASMVAAAHRAHVAAGGYDFLEVCRGSASIEAHVFAGRYYATRATDLLPAGDAEWPLSVPCSAFAARAWIATWVQTVRALTHRTVALYTGAWWWDPNVGCYWPPGVLSWISGYGVSFPSVPCGLSHVDVWQFTDHGFNGASYSDMSVLRVPLAALGGTTATLTRQQKREALWRAYRARTTAAGAIRVYHRLLEEHGCKTRPQARYGRLCVRWRTRGDEAHAAYGRAAVLIARAHRERLF